MGKYAMIYTADCILTDRYGVVISEPGELGGNVGDSNTVTRLVGHQHCHILTVLDSDYNVEYSEYLMVKEINRLTPA